MAQLLATLESMAGRDAVLAALGRYARANRFRHPTRRDLVDAFGDEWRDFFHVALLDPGGVDYHIHSVRKDAVTVENFGPIAAPAEVLVRLRDGSVHREAWSGDVGFRTFRYDSAIVEAEIDPDGKVLLEHDRLDDGWSTPDHASAARAAARLGFWEQTLQQVLGL